MELENELQITRTDRGIEPTLGGTGIVKSGNKGTSPDLSKCECDLPTLAVADGQVGPFEEQTLYCSVCNRRFCTVIWPPEQDEADVEKRVMDELDAREDA